MKTPSERRLAYLKRFQAEPVCFVRRKKRRVRPARKPGNALLSRLL